MKRDYRRAPPLPPPNTFHESIMSRKTAPSPTSQTLGGWLAERPYTLAMSSGFFGFYAHAGVLWALEEAGVPPAAVRGSSAGALITGLWAAGLSATAIANELLGLKREDFWDPHPGFGLLRGRLFHERLERMLPERDISRCRVPVKISVFDTLSRKTRILEEGSLTHAIRASCALPFLFQPVWIGKKPYLDGGIADRSSLTFAPPGERTLYHHLLPNSWWRKKNGASVQIPKRDELTTIAIEGMPRVSPYALVRGKTALEHAREITRKRLAEPLNRL